MSHDRRRLDGKRVTSSRSSGLQPLGLIVVLALVGGGLWMLLEQRGWLRSQEVEVLRGAPVQRGPLRISVLERGHLKAADSIGLKSEIEGQTTILFLVPEGTQVEEGTLVCELDATEQIDQRFQQQISVRNAEAAYVKSTQNYGIQKSQNDSDIKKAETQLFFAQTDLKKFQEGERKALQAEAEAEIKLAEEEFTRAGEKVDWSLKLNEKGFLTVTELEADRLSLTRAQIQLDQTKRDEDLLLRFQIPRDEADLSAKLEEAQRELERTRLQAAARLVDFEADMHTNEAKLELEREKLTKLETQIAKAKLYAPRAGMVVYAQEEGGRYGMSQPIKEGTEVRERQEIITIPSAGGMLAQVSLHESVLKQVELGQSALIQVDALPKREFHGSVRYVAVLPDQNSYWANPNLRLYRTEVALTDPVDEMRPGMSCAIEILCDEIPDALFVPVQAIFRRGSENLAFVDRDGEVQERAVDVGRYNDRWVEVVAGLSEGETVLLAAPAGFVPSVEETPPSPDGGPTAVADGRAAAPSAASTAAPREGERPRGEGGERKDEREGGRALDPAKAEEFRKRFENMSEEERAKAMEAFRAGGGGGQGTPQGGSRPEGGPRGGSGAGSGT